MTPLLSGTSSTTALALSGAAALGRYDSERAAREANRLQPVEKIRKTAFPLRQGRSAHLVVVPTDQKGAAPRGHGTTSRRGTVPTVAKQSTPASSGPSGPPLGPSIAFLSQMFAQEMAPVRRPIQLDEPPAKPGQETVDAYQAVLDRERFLPMSYAEVSASI